MTSYKSASAVVDDAAKLESMSFVSDGEQLRAGDNDSRFIITPLDEAVGLILVRGGEDVSTYGLASVDSIQSGCKDGGLAVLFTAEEETSTPEHDVGPGSLEPLDTPQVCTLNDGMEHCEVQNLSESQEAHMHAFDCLAHRRKARKI